MNPSDQRQFLLMLRDYKWSFLESHGFFTKTHISDDYDQVDVRFVHHLGIFYAWYYFEGGFLYVHLADYEWDVFFENSYYPNHGRDLFGMLTGATSAVANRLLYEITSMMTQELDWKKVGF